MPENPPDPQPPESPYTVPETLSGAVRSGFRRPSIVGPRELYASTAPFCQQVAPTASAAGDVAGSVTLDPAVENWRELSPDVSRTERKSKRGVTVAL